VIDVSRKSTTLRTATATATLRCSRETLARVSARTVPKGDALEVAKVAAIQAVKDTSRIVPYCHPLPIEAVDVSFDLGEGAIAASVSVAAVAKTGVEMEAMTGAAVAALTLYDMLKMLDDGMVIEGVRLDRKRGGKSDFRDAADRRLRAGILVVSDSVAAGTRSDATGPAIRARLEGEGMEIVAYDVVPDEGTVIRDWILRAVDTGSCDLVLTTGGTGIGPRDRTPEALRDLFDRDIPGAGEIVRSHGQARTPYAMLSRATAGVRGSAIIVALPGSRGGVADALDALFPALHHAFRMLWNDGSWESHMKEGTNA
jgi:cyclic pyranopterin phosphate synthase